MGLTVGGMLLGHSAFGADPSASGANPKDFLHSGRDLGGVGLLQMPTARFYADGQFEFGANFMNPHHRYYLSWQILPWLETTFRYTATRAKSLDLSNSGGGQLASNGEFLKDIFNGNLESTLDRGLDVKIKLTEESEYVPQIALGLQDFVGTGLFQGEFLALSKRFYDVDVTMGIGWGFLAGRGIAKNPFRLFSSHFAHRSQGGGGLGGNFAGSNLFAGKDIGLFGGIEYWLPMARDVSIKVEYNSSDPSEIPFVHIGRGFPIDVGINYRPFQWVDLGLGWERGDTLMLKVALRSNLHTAKAPLKIDQPPDPVLPREQVEQKIAKEAANSGETPKLAVPAPQPTRAAAARSPVTTGSITDAFERLAQTGVQVRGIRMERDRVVIAAEVPSDPHGDPDLAAARLLAASWPRPGDLVTLVGYRRGVPLTRTTVRAIGTWSTPAAAPQAAAVPASAPQSAEGAPAYDEGVIARRVFAELAERGFLADAFRLTDHEATVWVRRLKYPHAPQIVGRVARVVANEAPPNIDAITVVLMPAGLATTRATLLRSDLENIGRTSPEMILRNANIDAPGSGPVIPPDAVSNPKAYPKFSWALGPVFHSNIGSPNGLFLVDLDARLSGSVEVTRGLTLRGNLDKLIVGNLDQYKVSEESRLPHVRTSLGNYLRKGRDISIPNLQADYLFNVAPSTYGRVSAGLFEPMYGGVDGQVLYKPFDSRVGFGLEANWVRMRGYQQFFKFRGYQTWTGFASVYYELPFYNLLAAVHAGRYLAHDKGATFELSRRFASGVRVGAFATKTNVSAAKFGEGSFDKGFYMSIPFDLFTFTPTRTGGTFLFRPITRDGGARVAVGPNLYDVVTGDGQPDFADFWQELVY